MSGHAAAHRNHSHHHPHSPHADSHACERASVLNCRVCALEFAKTEAERAAKKYSQSKNRHMEERITHQEAGGLHANGPIERAETEEAQDKTKVQEMEKTVVTKRIHLLNELIDNTAPNIQPPVPTALLPSPEISIQYTYTRHTEGATYYPQRDRAWRVPIIWLALRPLFDKETGDGAINECLREIVPHLTRFATNDESSSPLRTWMVRHLKSASPFTRRMDTESFADMPHSATHHPACKPTHPPTPPLTVYSATCGAAGKIEIIVNTVGMEPHEVWHNSDINELVGAMLRHTGGRMQGHHSCTTLTVVVSDTANMFTHYLALHPFRSPDVCRVTHLVTEDGEGILDMTGGGNAHPAPMCKELHTHHYCPTTKRLNELELNSVHSMALTYADDTLDPIRDTRAPADAKSARISSANHDILVSSYRLQGEYPGVRTAISVFTYPVAGIRYKRDTPSMHTRRPHAGPARPPRAPKKRRPPQDRSRNVPAPATGTGNVKRQPRKQEDREVKMPPAGKMAWFYWHSVDNHNRWRIFIVDHSENRKVTDTFVRYNEATNRAINANFKGVWLTDKSMSENLMMNKSKGENGMTPIEYYRYRWRIFIDQEMMSLTYDDLAGEEAGEGDTVVPWYSDSQEPYLYASQSDVWKDIGSVTGEGIIQAPLMYSTYREYMEARVARDHAKYSEDAWNTFVSIDAPNQQSEGEPGVLLADPYSPIGVPGGIRAPNSESPPALMSVIRSMQARIDSMETERSRAEGNRAHVLLMREDYA